MRGRGRPKAKNVNLDVEILDEARSACNRRTTVISPAKQSNVLASKRE